MLFRDTVAVYCENHTEHTNTVCVGIMQNFSMLKRVARILVVTILLQSVK
jgi:hypothetical protein